MSCQDVRGERPCQASPYVCACARASRIERQRVSQQEVRQTDVSLTRSILQTRRVQPPPSHTGCVTHSFHFPLDVSGRASRATLR